MYIIRIPKKEKKELIITQSVSENAGQMEHANFIGVSL